MTRGCCVGLRLYRDGKVWRVDCHVVDGCDVKSSCLSAFLPGESWQKQLTHVVAAHLSCLDDVTSVNVVCVKGDPAVGRATASVISPTVPVVDWVRGLTWSHDVFRRQFTSQFGGVDPYEVLDFLKCRLARVIADHPFDKMPELRQVRCVLCFVCVIAWVCDAFFSCFAEWVCSNQLFLFVSYFWVRWGFLHVLLTVERLVWFF